MRAEMKIRKILGIMTLTATGILGVSSAQAVDVQWTSAILSTPAGDVGSTTQQYTGTDSVSKITATSWADDTFTKVAGNPNGPNLFGKNNGLNETGLGVVNAG